MSFHKVVHTMNISMLPPHTCKFHDNIEHATINIRVVTLRIRVDSYNKSRLLKTRVVGPQGYYNILYYTIIYYTIIYYTIL